VNSRHPNPRHVFMGGAEQQSADGIRGIQGIRRIRGWVPFLSFSIEKMRQPSYLPSPFCSRLRLFASAMQPGRYPRARSGTTPGFCSKIADLCEWCLDKSPDHPRGAVLLRNSLWFSWNRRFICVFRFLGSRSLTRSRCRFSTSVRTCAAHS